MMRTCQSGDRIHNYVLQEMIGTGTFGQVWRAKHHIFNEQVAVKIPSDPQFVRYLQKEGLVLHGLRHVNIVRILDLDPFAEVPYIIMEYVEGPTLREAIEQYPKGLAKLVVVEIFRGILSALTAAHASGIVHCDIKPANILLGTGQEDISAIRVEQVKVSDFGLGKIGGLTTASMIQSGSFAEDDRRLSGTIPYMSPEQRDGKDVDTRSDLYSCGVVLFEMLTGERPQGTDLPSHVRSSVDPSWDAIFEKCYARLDRRYRRAEDILDDLRRAFPHANGLDEVVPDSEPDSHDSPEPLPLGQENTRSSQILSCPSCGRSVGVEDQFCIHCGDQLVDIVPKCLVCQAYVYRSDKYCIGCGTKIEGPGHENGNPTIASDA